jgi:hypothetical protein
VGSAPLILTDGGLALSEPKAVGAHGSTKVLAASSLGSCLVFVNGAVVTMAWARPRLVSRRVSRRSSSAASCKAWAKR